MRLTAYKSYLKNILTLLLVLGSSSVCAQYKMSVYYNNGLSSIFSVEGIDSVSYKMNEIQSVNTYYDDFGSIARYYYTDGISYISQPQMIVHFANNHFYTYYVYNTDSITYTPIGTEIQNNPDETSVTGSAYNISYNSASVKAWANILNNLSTDVKAGIIFCTTGTPNKNNGSQIEISKSDLDSSGQYTVDITQLAPATTYYFRSYAFQSGLWFYGNINSFTTNEIANLVTGDASKITCYSAKVSSYISVDSCLQYDDFVYGICYGTNLIPTINDTYVESNAKEESGGFTCSLRALTGSTIYYYRPYAYINGFITYGPVNSFTTSDDNIIFTGGFNTNNYTVTSQLKIGSGAYSSLELGVCYGLNETPTINDYIVTSNELDENNYYSVVLNNIPFGGEVVYYRSYVKVDGTPHYGVIKSFESNSVNIVSINTLSLEVVARIKYNNWQNNIIYGLCYGLNETPTIDDKCIYTRDISQEGSYILNLKDVPVGKTYIRPFIQISNDVFYGDVLSLEGNEITTGTINTSSYYVQSHIKYSDGSIVYGICYGSNENPTVNDLIVSTNLIYGLRKRLL